MKLRFFTVAGIRDLQGCIRAEVAGGGLSRVFGSQLTVTTVTETLFATMA